MKRGRPKSVENAIPEELPKPTLGIPEPPDKLNEVGKAIFRRVSQVLTEMNVMTLADADLVAQYAEWYALAEQHSPTKCPTTFKMEHNGYRGISPDYVIWRDAQKCCQKILADLGMSPASRTRVAAVVKEEADEFTEFMKRRNASQE